MKILFICGSLEPAKDGVGDYSRKLAGELKIQGYEIMLVGLNDQYTSVLIDKDEDSGLSEHRLPGIMPIAERFKKLKELIDDFQPDWVSLQYVAYSFHKKGMPFGLVRHLKKAVKNINVHIMFHEIWQGESKESTVKDKVVGFFQKQASLSIVAALKPVHVSTTNDYYQKCLLKAGVQANKIPVFSNIPLGDPSHKEVYKKLPDFFLSNTADYLLTCFFGGFNEHEQLMPRLQKLAADIKQKLNRKLIITHAGKSNGVSQTFSIISKATGIPMLALGEWPENDIADYLASCDLGLSNHPKVLYEKSGSTAAMLYNQRPVIILKDSFEYDDRKINAIEEFTAINDIEKFINQGVCCSENYGVKAASHQYHNMFKPNL
jgi:hypothetical protein